MKVFGKLLGTSEAVQISVQNLRERLNSLHRKVAKIPNEKRLTVCRVLDLEGNKSIVAGPLSIQYDVISRAGEYFLRVNRIYAGTK